MRARALVCVPYFRDDTELGTVVTTKRPNCRPIRRNAYDESLGPCAFSGRRRDTTSRAVDDRAADRRGNRAGNRSEGEASPRVVLRGKVARDEHNASFTREPFAVIS